jgi:small GTP-binding protein
MEEEGDQKKAYDYMYKGVCPLVPLTFRIQLMSLVSHHTNHSTRIDRFPLKRNLLCLLAPCVAVVLLGDSTVGKSSLVLRYTKDEFNLVTTPTIGVEFMSKSLVIEGDKVRVELWDSAGQERFRAVSHVYYRGAVGCLLVYDISQRQTFENLHYWLDEVGQKKDNDMFLVLVVWIKHACMHAQTQTDSYA